MNRVLISGGSRGIRAALARAFAQNGEEEPFSLNDLTANLESLYNDYAPFRGDLVYIHGKNVLI